jgi:hypothetical protein
MLRGPDGTQLELPVVLECWAKVIPGQGATAYILVNSTPCIGDVGALYHPKEKTTIVYGPDLQISVKTGEDAMRLFVAITIPFMPLRSDGKEPALGMFGGLLRPVIEKAASRAKRARPRDERVTQKDVCFEHMEEMKNLVSGNRKDRFHYRQIFYKIRDTVLEETGDELKWENFTKIVTDYEAEHGEDKLAFRYPRGSIYIPHVGETLPLGTFTVEKYKHVLWQYSNILYLEKEGFFESLKSDGWPERHDCVLVCSKGISSGATRDFIDLIGKLVGDTGEPMKFFCVHDGDAAGSMVMQTLQEETKIRARRVIEVINLGLEIWEAHQLAQEDILKLEHVSYTKRQPTADYVDDYWDERLQRERCELDGFTTRQFIDWLDAKMAKHEARKVFPPADVMADRLHEQTRERLRKELTEKILAEAKLDDQLEKAMDDDAPRREEIIATLTTDVEEELEENPERHWRDVVDELADDSRGDPVSANPRA